MSVIGSLNLLEMILTLPVYGKISPVEVDKDIRNITTDIPLLDAADTVLLDIICVTTPKTTAAGLASLIPSLFESQIL